MANTGWTADEILAGVERGDFFLFPHPEGCVVGEFITSPRHRVMHVFAAGGTMRAVTDLGPVVEAFGRLHGCDMVSATGRKGWLRVSKQYGYEPAGPVIWKEL